MHQRLVYEYNGMTLLRVEEVESLACGEAYCEECGDCLACSEYYDCWNEDGEPRAHRWIVYEKEET